MLLEDAAGVVVSARAALQSEILAVNRRSRVPVPRYVDSPLITDTDAVGVVERKCINVRLTVAGKNHCAHIYYLSHLFGLAPVAKDLFNGPR